MNPNSVRDLWTSGKANRATDNGAHGATDKRTRAGTESPVHQSILRHRRRRHQCDRSRSNSRRIDDFHGLILPHHLGRDETMPPI
jgi:hypothetical protein